jgi:ribosomal-protein-alanine N-acetyltransferase
MVPEVILKYSKGNIRAFSEDEVTESYVNGLNDPDVNQYLEVRHTRQSIKTIRQFVRLNALSGDSILFGIFSDSRRELIGTIRLHKISRTSATAHIGICIFDKLSWGQGHGCEAISTVTSWVTIRLGINKVLAGIYYDNKSSRRAFTNAGYKFESIRNEVYNGCEYSVVIYEYSNYVCDLLPKSWTFEN